MSDISDLAGAITQKVINNYPGIPLVLAEVCIAAGLHDIGRPLAKNQLFHELRGARYLEKTGLDHGVADTVADVYRIAQMIRPHGFVYEFWYDPDSVPYAQEFNPLDPTLLIPRTWQEAIVAYSDLSSLDGNRITVEDRIKELLHRYDTDPRYKDGSMLTIIQSAEQRILDLAHRVESLEQGRLSNKEIVRYGFN